MSLEPELLDDLEKLRLRDNKNGFAVPYYPFGVADRIVVHYSCDPDKDPSTAKGREWLREARRGMDTPKWNREMEGDPFSHVGKAIFPDFRREIHIKKLEPLAKLPIVRGWDPGRGVSACVWIQILDDKTEIPQLRILRELQSFDADFGELVKAAIKISDEKYADWKGYWWDEIDVAGGQRTAASRDRTPLSILGEFGITARGLKTDPEDRAMLINHLLNSRIRNGEPACVIDESCTHTISGFLGLYRRKENSTRIDDTEVVHLMDALGYASYNNLYLKWKQKPKKTERRAATDFMKEVLGQGKRGKSKWQAC
jgi:hypothetical protein